MGISDDSDKLIMKGHADFLLSVCAKKCNGDIEQGIKMFMSFHIKPMQDILKNKNFERHHDRIAKRLKIYKDAIQELLEKEKKEK